MDRKQMCVANVKYKKPTANESKRMNNLLKYLTYRESRDEKARQAGGQERWMNHGMGQSATEIAERCEAYQSEHVLLFSLVINPNPDLIHMIPVEDREQFVRQLTHKTMNTFFDQRGIDTGVEYSTVLHHRNTDGKEASGLHNPHTHIVLPGTYYDADEGRRKPLYFSRNKQVNHIDMLHEITQENMVELMDRYAIPDWEQQYDELALIREQQEEIVSLEQAHGRVEDDPVWAGIRRSNEEVSAVGYYGYFEDRGGRTRVQFRPVIPEVDHEEAELLAEVLKDRLKANARDIQYEDKFSPSFDI